MDHPFTATEVHAYDRHLAARSRWKAALVRLELEQLAPGGWNVTRQDARREVLRDRLLAAELGLARLDRIRGVQP